MGGRICHCSLEDNRSYEQYDIEIIYLPRLAQNPGQDPRKDAPVQIDNNCRFGYEHLGVAPILRPTRFQVKLRLLIQSGDPTAQAIVVAIDIPGEVYCSAVRSPVMFR